MPRILIVEDSEEVALIISKSLTDFHLKQVHTLESATQELKSEKYDLLILDASLPDGDGFKFCASLQIDPAFARMPIFLVTARTQIEDKIMGLSLGADDYITKPFDGRELRARVQNRLRKASTQEMIDEVYAKGPLRFNIAKQKLYLIQSSKEAEIDTTPLEFKMLLHFAKNEDRVISREKLIDLFWGNSVNVLDRTVDAHISRLRKKLPKSGYAIKSIYGEGYSLSRSAD